MSPQICPTWEYEDFPDYTSVIQSELKDILIGIRQVKVDTYTEAKNTREFHSKVFHKLTPDCCPYYAGHYRGEDFECLKGYRVSVRGDIRVGFDPAVVEVAMEGISGRIGRAVENLDKIFSPDGQMPQKDKILRLVAVAACFFELFLKIHPYANGNGHSARYLVWVILGRYDLWLKDWPIDPRPKDPPYTSLIWEYRNGNKSPLEKFFFRSIIGR